MADKTVKIDIRVKADDAARNLEKVTAGVGRMDRSLKKVSDTMGYFRNLASTLAGFSILGIGVKQIVDMADSMTLLTSRIGIFVGEGQKTIEVMEKLGTMAEVTKSSFVGIKEVFSRMITATQRLNLSTESQLALTHILQQSFRLSGASTSEATASTIQFAQALSFGELRGQELRSVLTQNSTLATLFGRAIEGSGKDIYKFAEAGGFTAKFLFKILAENFLDIDEKAGRMAQTFSQTVTIAMNKLNIAVGKLNTEFNLNGKFAKFIDWMINNGDTVSAIIIGLAATAIPALTRSILTLNLAMLANPYVLLAAAIGTAAGAVVYFNGGVGGLIQNLRVAAIQTEIWRASVDLKNDSRTTIFKKAQNDVERLNKELADLEGKNIYDIMKPFSNVQIDILKPGFLDFSKSPEKTQAEKYAEALAAAGKNLPDPMKSVNERIGALNVSFNKESIGVEEYNSKLYNLTKLGLDEELLAGSISLSKMNSELHDLELANFSREMDYGSLSIEQFNLKVKDFQIEKLSEKFKKGKMTAAQFYGQMLKFSDPSMQDIFTGQNNKGLLGGLSNYVESLGTTSEQIASIVSGSFKNMEDAIFESLESGKRDFSAFTGAVIADLTRMMIRMAILKPLSQGILNFFPTPNGTELAPGMVGPTIGQANGGAWNNGVQMFANGGIVGSPTSFGMRGGKMGLMGEAGPEAILPLSRGSDGKLGVHGGAPVTVNVINQNGSNVETKSSTGPGGNKVIEILIKNTVKEGIGNGEFDKVMRTNFGTSRKGQ